MVRPLVKVIVFALLVIAVSIRFAFTCSTVPTYRPVYLSYEELRQSVTIDVPRSFIEASKILVKDNWLYVVDRDQGIHVIDNIDPSSPIPSAFIVIPGNRDIAIKGNRLYADSYVDLVVLDITIPDQASETGRLENVFPFIRSEDEFRFWSELPDPAKGVVVDAELDFSGGSGSCGSSNISPLGCTSGGSSSTADAVPNETATNGSLTAFTVVDSFLYLLSGTFLKVVDLTIANVPIVVSSTSVGFDVETVYAVGDAFYIGGQTGVRIFDITDRAQPSLKSEFSHQWQCDPIVVNNSIAYVTLRSGFSGNCFGSLNVLDILDVSDLTAPKLINQIPLTNPHGLAIDRNILFVADNQSGTRVLDVTDPLNVIEITRLINFSAIDVIALNQLLIVMNANGIAQYDYTDNSNIQLLSVISN